MSWVGIGHVAARAGVSVATVSNALNRPERVSPQTRQRVLEAARDLRYIPDGRARQLHAGSSSRAIALAMPDREDASFVDVAKGVESEAQANDYSVLLYQSRGARHDERALAVLQGHGVKGVLLAPVAGADETACRLRKSGTPFVLLDVPSSVETTCCVGSDDATGAKLAVRHLLDRGDTSLVFLATSAGPSSIVHRLSLAESALAAADGRAAIKVVDAQGASVQDGARAVAGLIRQSTGERPTAILCATDALAIGALQGLIALGARVPDDIAIVGFDDIPFAAAAAIGLSSVHRPRWQIPQEGTRLLLAEIGDGPEHEHRYVQCMPHLVVRDSSTGRRRVRRETPLQPVGV